MTTQQRTLEREMELIGFMIRENRLLRLQDFEPLLQEFRQRKDWQLFPLNRTTVKSALILAVKEKLVKVEAIHVGKRLVNFYKPTTRGRSAYAVWRGSR